MRILVLLMILQLGSLSALFGQKLTGKLSRSNIEIGEQIELTYSIRSSTDDSIQFEKVSDVLTMKAITDGKLTGKNAEIEIRTPFNDTSYRKNNVFIWKGTYGITAWDSGTFIIPGPRVTINDSLFYFQDLQLEVNFVQAQKGIDLYDIRENYTEIPKEPAALIRFIQSYYGFILLALALGVVYFLIRRRRKKPTYIEPPVSLKKRTLLAIEALEQEELWKKDKLKEHFVELSYLLRSYLTARYEIALLEKTSYQTGMLLHEKGLDNDTIQTINRILFQADMVKFAKFSPSSAEVLKISALAKQVVVETSPLDLPHDD